MTDLALASDFPAASEADWLSLAAKALAGAPFESLRTGLLEGFETDPLYFPSQTQSPVESPRQWDAVQRLSGASPQAIEGFERDLEAGVASFLVDWESDLPEGEAWRACFSREVTWLLEPGTPPAAVGGFLAKRLSVSPPKGWAGLDPITAFVRSGEIPASRQTALADAVDAAHFLHRHAPALKPFIVSDGVWHEAGGSAVEELAFTLAAAVAYWRALAQSGIEIRQAALAQAFSLTAVSDIFLTIAKFRAMRLLWARALAAAHCANPLAFILARTSKREMTVYDPHVNILRATAAAFGAALGGASAIVNEPFDGLAPEGTSLPHRVARNVSFVLAHEAHVSTVADTAAGSAYVESLTDELSRRAWGLFRDVERQGGLLRALESGFTRSALATPANARATAIASRRHKITGVSAFAHLGEAAKTAWTATKGSLPNGAKMDPSHALSLPPGGKGERLASVVEAANGGASLIQLCQASAQVREILSQAPALAPRDAEVFEVLRRRTDLALSRMGARPPVFLAKLGTPADFRVRAAWAQSFFAIGGIEAVSPALGFSDAATAADAFRKSPAPIACLCSSNAGYAAVAGVTRALKAAGALFVYVAAPPSVLPVFDPADTAAIDRLVYEGCNAAALLAEAHDVLRVEDVLASAEREAEALGLAD